MPAADKDGYMEPGALSEVFSGLILPGTLLLILSGLLIRRQLTELPDDPPIRNLLLFTVVKIVPMIALKTMIRFGGDRVTLLSRFAVKVLLMHVFFLALRVACVPLVTMADSYLEYNSPLDWWVNLLFLVCAFFSLTRVFNMSSLSSSFFEHLDVWGLVVLALAATFVFNFNSPSDWIVTTATNYIEVLAYMPAIWILKGLNLTFFPMPEQHFQMQAVFFFFFLAVFYLYEDLFSPGMTVLDQPLIMACHFAHLVVLLDFGGFFLQQAYARGSKREPGTMLQPSCGGMES